MWALCLLSVYSVAKVEKLRQSCYSFFIRAAFQDGTRDPCHHSVMPAAELEQSGAASVLTAISAASSPWLSTHPGDSGEIFHVKGNAVHDRMTSERSSQ